MEEEEDVERNKHGVVAWKFGRYAEGKSRLHIEQVRTRILEKWRCRKRWMNYGKMLPTEWRTKF